jgi:Protein of unknown function (DUF2844)
MAKIPHPLGLLLFACLACAAAPSASAALGGDVASVMRDSEDLKATHSLTPFVAYDLHESITADGMRLREYVDRGGTVFAVSWHGPRAPDLNKLLGAHAAAYHAAVHTRLSNHHIVAVDEGGLVVTVLRLPRGWSGGALLASAIPAGVSRDEIR